MQVDRWPDDRWRLYPGDAHEGAHRGYEVFNDKEERSPPGGLVRFDTLVNHRRIHPAQYVDEEKQRILAAVQAIVEGRHAASPPAAVTASTGVVDLMEALRASLATPRGGPSAAEERKPVKRAAAKPKAPAKRARSAAS